MKEFDDKLSKIIKECSKGAHGEYTMEEGFLFNGNRLCVPKGSFKEVLIKETHSGGLTSHFGVYKTLEMLKEYF